MARVKKTVYDEIKEAQQKRAATLADLRAKLAKAEADRKKADKTAAEAIKDGNADTYTTAKADGRIAAEKVEFFRKLIKETESAPLFDNYTEVIAEIKADQQKKIDQINEKATKAMHELNTAIAAFYEDLGETNKALELVYINTKFTFRETIPLHIKGIYRSTESVRVNPELSKYW